jgi:hypothetical protein
MLNAMDEFTAVSKARETYALFAEAMEKGRDIIRRAGIVEAPPPVPVFDEVFRRLRPDVKRTLYAQLAELEATPTTVDALRIWQPLLKKAFAPATPRT